MWFSQIVTPTAVPTARAAAAARSGEPARPCAVNRTLYGYFPSKEDLLRAVLQCQVASELDRVTNEFQHDTNLRDGLIKLGVAYHRKRLSALPVANIRSIVNQPPCSTMGKEFYENVLHPAFGGLA